MKAKIIDAKKMNMRVLKKVVNAMKRGGIIIYPTETCYGIGGDATNPKSIEKIYKIKGRDLSKPIPILVSSLNMIKKYGIATKNVETLIKKFMPGPLSIIIKKRAPISNLNQNSVSFRISSHPIASVLVKLLKKPMTTTSANISGQNPMFEIKKIIGCFENKVDIILNFGNLPKTKMSTCVDMTNEDDVKVVREGVIPSKLILQTLENDILHTLKGVVSFKIFAL